MTFKPLISGLVLAREAVGRLGPHTIRCGSILDTTVLSCEFSRERRFCDDDPEGRCCPKIQVSVSALETIHNLSFLIFDSSREHVFASGSTMQT